MDRMMQSGGNMRRGGRPSRFEPAKPITGKGLLGDAPGIFPPPPGAFGQSKVSLLGQGPQVGSRQAIQQPGSGAGFGMMSQALLNMGGGGRHPQTGGMLQPRAGIMGNMMQQQQQQQQHHQQQQQHHQQQQQRQQQVPTQNIRDTQLTIVNNLLKGVMSGPGSSSLDSRYGSGMSAGGSILGRNQGNFDAPAMPLGLGGGGAQYRQQGMANMLAMGQMTSGRSGGPGIPSIFDISTNAGNRRLGNSKRMGNRDGWDKNEPDHKRYRRDSAPSNQNRSRNPDRQDNRNTRRDNHDAPRRPPGRFAADRRDSHSSSQSERSLSNRPASRERQHGVSDSRSLTSPRGTDTEVDVYDPAEPTEEEQGREHENDEDEEMVEEEAQSESKELTEETDGDGDLKVTFDDSGRSVSDRVEARERRPKKPAVKKSPYFCHACNVECSTEQNFTNHMRGNRHKETMEDLLNMTQQRSTQLTARMKAEAHLRNIEGQNDHHGDRGDRAPTERTSYCGTCDMEFTGGITRHRRSQEHRINDKLSWPVCKQCKQSFKSPQKYVKHLKTSHHRQNNVQMNRDSPKNSESETVDEPDEDWPEFLNPEDLVTLDAVGLTDEEMESDDENDKEDEEPTNMPEDEAATEDAEMKEDDKEEEMEPTETEESNNTALKESSSGDAKKTTSQPKNESRRGTTPASRPEGRADKRSPYSLPPFDGATPVGQRFIIAVSGFFCKICHKFYNTEAGAKINHCQSQAHYEKYQKLVYTRQESRKISKGLTSSSGQSGQSNAEKETVHMTTSGPINSPDTTPSDLNSTSCDINISTNGDLKTEPESVTFDLSETVTEEKSSDRADENTNVEEETVEDDMKEGIAEVGEEETEKDFAILCEKEDDNDATESGIIDEAALLGESDDEIISPSKSGGKSPRGRGGRGRGKRGKRGKKQ